MKHWLSLIDSAVVGCLFAACIGRWVFELGDGTWDWPAWVGAIVLLYLGTALARKFMWRPA